MYLSQTQERNFNWAPSHGFKKDLDRKPDPKGLDGFQARVQEDIQGNQACGSEETVVTVYTTLW